MVFKASNVLEYRINQLISFVDDIYGKGLRQVGAFAENKILLFRQNSDNLKHIFLIVYI